MENQCETHPYPPVPEEPILERLPHVKARTGLSRSEIYRRISLGGFPAPVKLGLRISAWSKQEVDAWISQRIAERDAKGAA